MDITRADSSFSIVFSGGGCRTFWSLGVYTQVRDLLPKVHEWAGVSAGSAMAIVSCSDLVEETISLFKDLTELNKRNAYIGNLFTKEPVFPHEAIYRMAIGGVLKGRGFQTLHRGAPVRILLAYVKGGYPRLNTVFGAMRAYRWRKNHHVLHGPDEPHPGLGAETVVAQDYNTVEELCDVVLASSATPPMTHAPVTKGRMYIDGGFVDHAPVRSLSNQARLGKALVLLTRPFPEPLLPQSANRYYMAPSRPVPIAIWDYTSPGKIDEAFELGRKDGRIHRRAIADFIERKGVPLSYDQMSEWVGGGRPVRAKG